MPGSLEQPFDEPEDFHWLRLVADGAFDPPLRVLRCVENLGDLVDAEIFLYLLLGRS